MKLASLNNGDRDGQLLVVDQNLQQACTVGHIAHTMQSALDNWTQTQAALQETYAKLNNAKVSDSFALKTEQLMAPLPRAYQWADASAYVTHVELVRKARGAEIPASFWTDPLMYQGGSDDFGGPRDAIVVADLEWGVDFESEIAIICNDVPAGADLAHSEEQICLFMLVNDVSLRNLVPNELAKGFGFFQSKPSSSFSPVAVTPDELGAAWQNGKVCLPLISTLNEECIGRPDAGVDMTFNFPQLVAHAAKTRRLCAGTIIGSGTVSNRDHSVGSSCLAEIRMLEKLNDGSISTPFMNYGDTIKIEMFNKQGTSIFGAIEQTLLPPH